MFPHRAARWQLWQILWPCLGLEWLDCSPWTGILGGPRLPEPPRGPWVRYLQGAAGGSGKAGGIPHPWSLSRRKYVPLSIICFIHQNIWKYLPSDTSSTEPGSKKVTLRPSPGFFTGVLTLQKDINCYINKRDPVWRISKNCLGL